MIRKNGLLILASVLFLALLLAFTQAISFESQEDNQLIKVYQSNQDDARLLNRSGLDIVLTVSDGYLALAKNRSLAKLSEMGLKYELLESGLERSELAFDKSWDRQSINYPLIYEDSEIRLYRVDPAIFNDPNHISRLAPVGSQSIRASYDRKSVLKPLQAKAVDLEALIAQVEQDSLESYVYALQAFPPRVTGSVAGSDSRDWVYNKFVEFGYDSVVYDSFLYSGNNVQNIIAYKIGTTLPDHQIIIGGHKDAVSGSPGADDNASGAGGVLEMARILKDVETDMTFIFICFTGEEQGLHGSWHYADAAVAAGDSIVMMLNMDMIGNEGNTNDVKVYHGSDQTYADLFIYLADSLSGINLTGHLAGTITASDHWPFQSHGYDVILPHEYIFSSVYHSYQDSTSHMDFPYMTKVVKASLATSYWVNGTYVPVPGLVFSYPLGLPEIAVPGTATVFNVQIDGSSGGVHIGGTGQLYYSTDGTSYSSAYMADLGGGLYEASIPPMICGDGQVYYYFSGEESTTGTNYDGGPSSPYTAYVATEISTVFYDDFESDLGWTVSGGLWARGTPTGGGGDNGHPDPASAFEGANVFGYNLNGDYENDLAERYLTSPAIDCSSLTGAKLKFMRWLGVEQPSYDHAYIKISSDGSNWSTIWENSEEVADGAWIEQEFDISSYADGQSIVYIRFVMGSTDGSWQYCGWNLDNLQVSAYSCLSTDLAITTDALEDWTAMEPISVQLEAINGAGTLVWTDLNNDLAGSGLSLSASGLLSGVPTVSGAISFTAQVVDDDLQTDQKLLGFAVNEAVAITVLALPDWTEGIAFSQQLTSTGGTGSILWQDKNGDLSGTGLTISLSGLVAGTPDSDGSIIFTAEAGDIIGSSDEHMYSFAINPPVTITTNSLPEGYVGLGYSQQLEQTGGTGAISWSDLNNDLDGAGLSLDASGLLSGVPNAVGDILFTAEASDDLGSIDTYPLVIIVSELFVCGDATGDGEVNILDITYLIAYLYAGGIAPNPIDAADVNNNGAVNIIDVTALISFLYSNGTIECP